MTLALVSIATFSCYFAVVNMFLGFNLWAVGVWHPANSSAKGIKLHHSQVQ